jgi:hypothetical protein
MRFPSYILGCRAGNVPRPVLFFISFKNTISSDPFLAYASVLNQRFFNEFFHGSLDEKYFVPHGLFPLGTWGWNGPALGPDSNADPRLLSDPLEQSFRGFGRGLRGAPKPFGDWEQNLCGRLFPNPDF